jgi:hypothetical protein
MSTLLDDGTEVFNIHEAKTHFSELVARVERGDKIAVARAGKPVVRLDLFFEGEAVPKIRFGLGAGDPAWEALADVDWLEPMSEEELALWE